MYEIGKMRMAPESWKKALLNYRPEQLSFRPESAIWMRDWESSYQIMKRLIRERLSCITE